MKNSTKMLASVAIGVVAGNVLALLSAPDKGKDTRKKIAKKSDDLVKTIEETFSKE